MARIRARSGGVVRERGVQSRRARRWRSSPTAGDPPPRARQPLAGHRDRRARRRDGRLDHCRGARAAASPTDRRRGEPDRVVRAATPPTTRAMPPVEDTHDAPELEALASDRAERDDPAVQSWTGDAILTDDALEHLDDGLPDEGRQDPRRPAFGAGLRPDPGARRQRRGLPGGRASRRRRCARRARSPRGRSTTPT